MGRREMLLMLCMLATARVRGEDPCEILLLLRECRNRSFLPDMVFNIGRICNVGLKDAHNFRIQGHPIMLVETKVALHSNRAAKLTSPPYFIIAISPLNATKALDPIAPYALVSFMAITLPLVPPCGITTLKLHEAAGILVAVLTRDGEELGAACVRDTIKCLGVLIGFWS
ncbi:unnamed protein product [Sphenostylis stenocarpa]|uniref:RRP12 N-terminal HEAT domain-containing protein n=1 Tax=Sphenostylis stenocarpa TaxID=92480 RepID=A0AA86SST3_9FABA|nr:unnamed protein product [Sphenostylis stenocarpa]